MKLPVVLCVSLLFVFLTSSAYAESPRAQFTQHLRRSDALEVKEVTSSLGAGLRPIQRGHSMSYARLKRYYERALKGCARQYPKGVFEVRPETPLSSYSGSLGLEEPETFSVPCMLVSLRAADSKELKFYRLETTFKGETVYGLRVQTRVRSVYRRLPTPYLSQYNIPDVNARAAGFSHARLILPLSKNVRTANKFDYNGVKDWSEHQRYSGKDQVQRAIEMTNWAHAAGSRYVISAHPDFALQFPNYKREKILLTFFMWKDSSGNKVPEFVYQLELIP